MKTSIAVLALIGAIDLTQAINLQFVPQNIVQTGTVDENAIKWDQSNVQLSRDTFDADFDREHAEAKVAEFNTPNRFDGLIHAQNGKVYDPNTKAEVHLEDDYVQTDESRFQGEPIALLQQQQALQWHGHGVEMADEDWYDRTYERFLSKQEEERQAPVVNMFDGMIHAQDGRIFDPVNGREVDQDFEDIQTNSNEWFDDSMDRAEHDRSLPKQNQFDGFIHTKSGRMFSPVDGKEVIMDDYDYLQTGDIYDEDLENRMVQKAQKQSVFAVDGLFHTPKGGSYDPMNGRNLESETKFDDEFTQIESEQQDYDSYMDEHPDALIKIKGMNDQINPASGSLASAEKSVKTANLAQSKSKDDWADRVVGEEKPNQFDGLIHLKNGHVIDPVSKQDVTSQQEDYN